MAPGENCQRGNTDDLPVRKLGGSFFGALFAEIGDLLQEVEILLGDG